MRLALLSCLIPLGLLFVTPAPEACAKDDHGPIKEVTVTIDHQEKKEPVGSADERKAFFKKLEDSLENGKFEELKPYKPVNVMELKWDLGLWAVVIFLALFFILRAKAWGPILDGLQKREADIRSAVEEAKIARAETQRLQAQYKAEMDAKFAEIPKIMEEARRDAEALKEELRSQANKEIQADRQRLRREVENARDQALKEIWEQAAQLATLISAKVIGRSLSQEDHHRLIDESLLELREAGPQLQASTRRS